MAKPRLSETVLDAVPNPDAVRLWRVAVLGTVVTGILCGAFLVVGAVNFFAPYRFYAVVEQLDSTSTGEPSESTARIPVEALPHSALTDDFLMDNADPSENANSAENANPAAGAASVSGASDSASEESGVIEPMVSTESIPFRILPTESREFVAVKKELLQRPNDTALQARARELDSHLRGLFFRKRVVARRVAVLFLIAAGCFILFARTAATLSRRIPRPEPLGCPGEIVVTERAERSAAFFGVSIFSALCLGIAVGQIFGARSELGHFLAKNSPVSSVGKSSDTKGVGMLADALRAPNELSLGEDSAENRAASGEYSTASTVPVAGVADWVADEIVPDPRVEPEAYRAVWNRFWPQFRGPLGSGVVPDEPLDAFSATEVVAPIWDFSTGAGVDWSVEVPLSGHGSPIAWGERIFVTGADESGRALFCFHAKNGSLLWSTDIPISVEGAGTPMVNPDTGDAPATPATDGTRVFVSFPNGDVTAVDFSGRIVWQRGFGIPKSHYGWVSSPITDGERLFIQLDEEPDASRGGSRRIALSNIDGSVIWETSHPDARAAWSSPLWTQCDGRPQLVVMGDPYVAGYDPADGTEWWRLTAFHSDVAVSPIFFAGTIFAAHTSPYLAAIEAGATGDLKGGGSFWTAESSAMPNTAGPVPIPGFIVMLSENGILSGVNLPQRETVWELAVTEADSFYASPIYHRGRLFLFAKTLDEPHAYVIDAAKIADDSVTMDLFEIGEIDGGLLATIPLPEPVNASPAILGDRLILRGEKTLWSLRLDTPSLDPP